MITSDTTGNQITITTYANYVRIAGNTFDSNGAHVNGVLWLETMANVNITEGNSFVSNTDDVDLNTNVVAHWVSNNYYFLANFAFDATASVADGVIYLEECSNIELKNLSVTDNSCGSDTEGKTAGIILNQN